PPPFRPGHHRDLPHPLLLSVLSRAFLRAGPYLTTRRVSPDAYKTANWHCEPERPISPKPIDPQAAKIELAKPVSGRERRRIFNPQDDKMTLEVTRD
ncbi:hypothetical protein, partial [Sphingobium sp. WCS2017Hpa-17]|uniref:hypothetical protein n=1 Tax=Sphingobium sp. WCS2017Hpa-17 TaxID=3073638 RepID=UPI00288AA578